MKKGWKIEIAGFGSNFGSNRLFVGKK